MNVRKIDLKKGYDKMNKLGLWNILNEQGVES